jgi:RimJ/RimL family protein N-acetyltransferase
MKDPIIGNRIILRKQQDEDAEFFGYWYNKPEVMFQCGFFEKMVHEEIIANIKNPATDSDWYTITDLDGKIVGETGLLRIWPHWHCTDMSMIIPNPDDQGKGYGTEAAKLMLARAFNFYKMNRISIGVVELNKQAVKFWESLGFKKEGIQEQGYFYNEEFSDFVMMRILRSEYKIVN